MSHSNSVKSAFLLVKSVCSLPLRVHTLACGPQIQSSSVTSPRYNASPPLKGQVLTSRRFPLPTSTRLDRAGQLLVKELLPVPPDCSQHHNLTSTLSLFTLL
ncbi:hypothetical protein FPOAC2_03473 [Fusarium poae]